MYLNVTFSRRRPMASSTEEDLDFILRDMLYRLEIKGVLR